MVIIMRRNNAIRMLIYLLSAVCFIMPIGGRCQKVKEYEVKAAFLFNFAKFTEWPAGAFPKSDSPFVIGVFGNDPFGQDLDKAVKDKKVKDRKIVIRRMNRIGDVGDCHILFVSSSEQDRLAAIFNRVRNKPILTVGDWSGFARRGGVINFILRNNTIGFEINTKASDRAKLQISSQVLRLARIV